MLSKAVLYILYVFLLITCIVHISVIFYYLINPKIPSVKIDEVDLSETSFPLIFWFCIDDKTNEKYKDIGYENDYNFFFGKSKFNDSMFGWNGHKRDGTTRGSVEGKSNLSLTFMIKMFQRYGAKDILQLVSNSEESRNIYRN